MSAHEHNAWQQRVAQEQINLENVNNQKSYLHYRNGGDRYASPNASNGFSQIVGQMFPRRNR